MGVLVLLLLLLLLLLEMDIAFLHVSVILLLLAPLLERVELGQAEGVRCDYAGCACVRRRLPCLFLHWPCAPDFEHVWTRISVRVCMRVCVCVPCVGYCSEWRKPSCT